jgi:hypothetical protein
MRTRNIFYISILMFSICFFSSNPTNADESIFATWNAPPVDIVPCVPDYAINPDLSNVVNFGGNVLFYYYSDDEIDKSHFDTLLSKKEQEMLAKNGFCVNKSYYKEFFQLYEENRYCLIANLVTTDSILHNYHLMFDHILQQLEEEKLSGELEKISDAMIKISLDQYEQFKGTEWENPAKRNVAFFSVGLKLLNTESTTPSMVKKVVEAELALIEAAGGIAISPVMNMTGEEAKKGLSPLDANKEDYTQYIPRGHYTKSELLKRYFKSMMWYGLITFRLKNDDEVRSAILMSYAINDNTVRESYEKIFDTVNFFVGQSDDLTYYQFDRLIREVYGEKSSWQTVNENSRWFFDFMAKADQLPPPQINSMPIFDASTQPDREREIKGFRFMEQRFTIDASIFQRLVDREVPDRMLPKGLDIPAAMGSDDALKILEEMGETKHINYLTNMGKMRSYISGLDADTWTQNLYWGWLYTIKSLTDRKGPGYPMFMRSNAWARKELNTWLGSWTELKHDTILYAKQCYAECGGDGEGELYKRDDRGYVEPNINLYSRLTGLIDLTTTGLDERGLLSDKNREILDIMKQLSMSLYTISQKELLNETLTDEEYELIRSYGAQIEHLWIEINQKDIDELGYGYKGYFLDENPAAIVADVATDPNGSVLEEGTGRIFEIWAIAPVAGELKLVSGGVYSHYEFAWPMENRLTDQEWRSMLSEPQCPPLAEWIGVYLAGKIDNNDFSEYY